MQARRRAGNMAAPIPKPLSLMATRLFVTALLVVTAPVVLHAQPRTLAGLWAAAPRAQHIAPASSGPSSGALTIGLGAVAYHSIALAVDARGGQHAAYVHYAGGTGGQMPVYYAYCPATSDCGDAAAWQRVPIGTNETFVQMALTPGGRPRVLMHHETLATPWGGGETVYTYAECDDACLAESGWRRAQVVQNQNGGATNSADYAAHTFALDGQGRPRFVHQQALGTSAAFLAGCDTACSDAAHWWQRRLPLDAFGDRLKRSAFTIAPDGSFHLLTTIFTTLTTEALVYLACPATCAGASDWQVSAPLLDISGNDTHRTWTLAADRAGRPRFALAYSNTTAYAWCDAGCNEGAGWFAQQLAFGDRPSRYPTLVLDGQDRPRLAFQEMARTGLGYAWCESGCETDAADWRYTLAEDDDVLDDALPVAPLAGCQAGAWYGGYRPALALDGQGNPYLGYDAEHLMPCYRDPLHPEYGSDTRARWWTARVVFFPQPGGASTPETPAERPASRVSFAPAYPNPATSAATFSFTLPQSAPVQLAVFDALGRAVAVLVDETRAAGTHRVAWGSAHLPAGRYFARLRVGGQVQTQMVTLAR